MDGYRALGAEGLLPPDRAVDRVGPEDPAGVLHHQPQDVILGRGKAHRLAIQRDLLAPVVQADPADRKHPLLHRPAAELQIAPQLRAHAGQQLHGIERLGNVVVRTEIQAEDLVRVFALGGQKDHRHVAPLPDLGERRETVEARHHDVEQYKLHLLAPEKIQRLLPAVGTERRIALRFQIDLQRRHDILFVVADQDFCHPFLLLFVFFWSQYTPLPLKNQGGISLRFN